MVGRVHEKRQNLAARLFGGLARSGAAEAALATMLYLYSESFYSGGNRVLTWTQFALDTVLCMGAAASGRWPRSGGVIVGVAVTAGALMMPGSMTMAILAVLIPLYAAGSRGLEKWRTVLTLWLVPAAIWATLIGDSAEVAVQTVVAWVIMTALVWALGSILHRLQQRTVALTEERIDAIRAQRRSIARDLHDTVAYATTTMIMRAEQIKLRGTADPLLTEDLDFIIATGRRSIRDLRGMMEALRRNDPSLDAAGGEDPWRVVSLTTLLPQRVRELEAHGLTVSTSVDAHLAGLPESVRETLGKLIVEATSNMVKHADRSGPCRILIEETPDAVEAVFTNAVSSGSPNRGAGFGLVGARERIEALGGDFEATRTHGTWLLRASLPVGG